MKVKAATFTASSATKHLQHHQGLLLLLCHTRPRQRASGPRPSPAAEERLQMFGSGKAPSLAGMMLVATEPEQMNGKLLESNRCGFGQRNVP